MKISRDKAIDLIRGSNGKIFNVTFIKRTTGEVRKMNARLGVSKYVTGEGLKLFPMQKVSGHRFQVNSTLWLKMLSALLTMGPFYEEKQFFHSQRK